MIATATETQLRQLREGDRLKYHGVHWRVADYSTYTDAKGYETEEWTLKSNTNKEYCLMREVDPEEPDDPMHWYLAEELRHPTIYEPGSSRDLLVDLARAIPNRQEPYPELQVFNRIYQFESQTEGDYRSESSSNSRITWDYWDEAHLWNLALEYWPDGSIAVYSTREVQPADFTNIQHGTQGFTPQKFQSSSPRRSRHNRSQDVMSAWILIVIGFLLMIVGI